MMKKAKIVGLLSLLAVVCACAASGALIETFREDFESYDDEDFLGDAWLIGGKNDGARGYYWVAEDSAVAFGDKMFIGGREPNQDANNSHTIRTDPATSDLRLSGDPTVLVLSTRMRIANQSPEGSGQLRMAAFSFRFFDSNGTRMGEAAFRTMARNNKERQFRWMDGTGNLEFWEDPDNPEGAWAVDSWYTVVQTVDETAGTYGFVVLDDNETEIFSRSNLGLETDGRLASVGFYFGSGHSNDGFHLQLDDVVVQVIPEPSAILLLGLSCSLLVRSRRRRMKSA